MKLYNYFVIAMLIIVATPAFSQTDSLNQTKPPSDTLSANQPADTMKQKSEPGEIYKLNLAVDIPVTAVGMGWSLYAFSYIYNKDSSTVQQILDLDENDIPKFDRWAAGMHDDNADMVSDYFFYGSIPYAFTLLLSKEIRRDGLKVGLMYLEAMSITGLFYTGTVYFVDRYRPETYNKELPIDERTSGNEKDAFMAGHPALVATSTFFAASVFSAYHPKSIVSYTAYGIAIAATGTTVYLRHLAGKHFPSDLLVGTTVGTLSGLLVPRLHKIKTGKDQNLGIFPYRNGKINGMAAIYRF